MKLTLKNFPAFLLTLSGAMAFGSLYSALINKVGVDITPMGIVFTGLCVLFIAAGWYSFAYLSTGKGNKILAIILVVLAGGLACASLLRGKSESQVWFAAHEILNAGLPIVILIQLIFTKKKAD